MAFAPTGELAIASPGSDEIKLWPQPSETSNVILQPSSTIKISADAKSEHISWYGDNIHMHVDTLLFR